LLLSASSSFSRFRSATVVPLYFAFRWKYVARLMPCFRSSSTTGSPASPSFRISTICVSLNRDLSMSPSLGPAGESLRLSGLLGRGAYKTSTRLILRDLDMAGHAVL
jgi:hypothetical protein